MKHIFLALRFPLLALPLVLVLSACASSSPYESEPNYKLGYSDGCWTGTSMVPGDKSTITRDDVAYGSDEAYRAGWKKGYGACKVRQNGGSVAMPDSTGRGTGPNGY
ncbi:MAG: hypothetical protein GC184_06495 [Rhizobiales bacterium]|nr:hypothetical protein [Hyphomicrobiales bacterium]